MHAAGEAPNAWVMCDQVGVRQNILSSLGLKSLHFSRDLHSKEQLRRILNMLEVHSPRILWIRLGGPSAGSGNRHDNQRALHFSQIAQRQIDKGGLVVLEANARSMVWSLRFVQELSERLHVYDHAWCWHERRLGVQTQACDTMIRIATNIRLPGPYGCECPSGTLHIHSKQLSQNERHVRNEQVLRSIVQVALNGSKLQGASFSLVPDRTHGRPESTNQGSSSAVVPQTRSTSSSQNVGMNSVSLSPFAGMLSSHHEHLDGGSKAEKAGSATHVRNIEHSRHDTATIVDSTCIASEGREVDALLAELSAAPHADMYMVRRAAMIQTVENHAKRARLDLDYSFKTCLRILNLMPSSSHGTRRQAVNSSQGGSCRVLGLYKHGAEVGITQLSLEVPETCRYLNLFAFEHQAVGGWTSISVNHNVTLQPHWDYGNLRGTLNNLIGLGDYSGGQLWVQLYDHEIDSQKHVEWMISDRAEKMPGRVLSCKHRCIHFEPERVRSTLPWSGDRFTLSLYTNRALQEVSSLQRQMLDGLGFPLSRIGKQSVVGGDTSTFFPTEQALKQKARLKIEKEAGRAPKKRLQNVEQINQDCGEDLSAILPVTDCVSWDAKLLGSNSEKHFSPEEANTLDILYDAVCRPGLCIHGSSVDKPWRELCMNGVCSIEQTYANLNGPLKHSEFLMLELFGGVEDCMYLSFRGMTGTHKKPFDFVVQFNPHNNSQSDRAFQMIRAVRPSVILMCPRVSTSSVVAFCLNAAAWQSSCEGHWVVEQRKGSALLDPFIWNASSMALHASECGSVVLLASDSSLIGRVGKSHDADRFWTVGRCAHFTAAVADLCHSMWESESVARMQSAYPSDDTSKFECPGCKWHKRKDDPSHLRVGDCKFPDVEPKIWDCPGCKASKPRTHDSHTLEADCQWQSARTVEEGLQRERKGSRPRDPRVPAASEPTAQARVTSTGAGSSGGGMRKRDASSQVTEGGYGPYGRDRRDVSSSSRGPEPGARRDAPRVARSSDASAAAAPARASVGVDTADEPPVVPVPAGVPVANEEAEPPAGEGDDVAPWARFDIGRTLQQLRSCREAVVRRALRQLHVRFYHPSTQRLRALLSAAGVPAEVLEKIAQITDTCTVCRTWARPGPKSVASSHLPSAFNAELQVDLLFIREHVILHMIDVATRFVVAKIVPSRETNDILTALQEAWVSLFGPPSTIVADQEGALSGAAGGAWMSHRDIKYVPKAKYAHASVVERHNALLRRQVHLLLEQSNEDGLRVPFSAILAEAVFAKNALLRINNFTPYEAVLGRTPPLYDLIAPEFGEEVAAKDADRLRGKALRAILQATAESKAQRAAKSKSRLSGEPLELSTGDQVEFFRTPSNKDLSGWAGPATVVDLQQLDQGQVGITFQGRYILCRVQDIRRALMFATFLSDEPHNTPSGLIRIAAESLDRQSVRLGWFRQQNVWRSFAENSKFSDVLVAGLHLAACNLQLSGVVSFRLGNGLNTLSGVQCDESFLIWWPKGQGAVWNHMYLPGTQSVNFSRLSDVEGKDLCFLQFFCEDSETVLSLRRVVHDIPNVGGVFDPALPRLSEVNEAVLRRRQVRAITDRAGTDQTGPEVFDISTPDGVTESSERHSEDTPEGAEENVEEDSDLFAFSGKPPEVCVDSAVEPSLVFTTGELKDEALKLEFSQQAAKYLAAFDRQLESNETLVLNMSGEVESVIERANNILTRQEALENVDRCRRAMVKELLRWNGHKAWRRGSKASARNALQSKWVLKWKNIQGERDVKARLVVQGFRDTQTVESYASTTTRWGQRLLLAIAVQQGWPLKSADVSEAFLRGLSFEELHRTGVDKELREVQLLLPAGSLELIRSVPGLETFNPETEVLHLLKPGFGLKDAPRLWNLALKRVLKKVGLQPTNVDPQLYVLHAEGRLILLLSVHVDDLKITGLPTEIARTVKVLEEEFDALKLETDNFEHLGLKHKLEADGSRTVSQEHYVSELRPIAEASLKASSADDLVSSELAQKFMSLLGGVAWCTQTRPDISVYVAALQRRLKNPRVQDLVNLNRVLKYLKLKPLCLRYRKLSNPWRLVAISDSSFKGEGQDHLAMRSGIIALTDRDGPVQGMNTLQILEFVCRKQTRVCRSTYMAELLSAVDLSGLAITINSGITEVLQGVQSAAELLRKQEQMNNALQLTLVIDAMAVFLGATSEEARCTDSAALLHLLALRQLLRHEVSALAWCDTRDMLCDGLNKGVISREPIRLACTSGSWQVDFPLKFSKPTNTV